MSTIDEVLRANERDAQHCTLGHLALPPARQLAIVACMDARLMVDQLLGLQAGEAHIIRHAGGIVTEDALRSLMLSHHLLGTQEFMIINHTDGGMLTCTDEDVRATLQQLTGTATVAPMHFQAFRHREEHVRQQLQKVTSHPWIPTQIPVRGFIDDVTTGRLHEVST
jgi:carbonic anhydrase